MTSRLEIGARLQAGWDAVRTSLWFVPTLMMAIAVVLAAGGLWFDGSLSAREDHLVPWWIFVSSPDDARNVLGALLTSMITMTSLVFSITMVVLSLAANQFGPRLVRNFMASPQTQIVLGVFVMTIVYYLIILSAIGWRGSEGEHPFSTITAGIVLMGASVALLVFFIHTLARSIVSETVIERVGRELDAVFGELEPLGESESDDNPEQALPSGFEQEAVRFGPTRAGYIKAIEFERLTAIASEAGAVIGLYFRPGDYVAEDGNGIVIYPRETDTPALRGRILRAIIVGVHRTPVQDPEYAVRHLVEIGVRALSPGTNDPYTAVAVIHRLSASLAQLMRLALPPGVFRDEAGAVRVVCPRPDYRSLIAGSFDQIRQNGANNPIIIIHLLEALTRIADHATRPEQVDVLAAQLDIIRADAERELASPGDKEDVLRRAAKAREAIGDALARISGNQR